MAHQVMMRKLPKVITLLYHDVVAGDRYDVSGFGGAIASRYKLSAADFADHLRAVAKAVDYPPGTLLDLDEKRIVKGWPVLLTFDDGGASAYHVIADALEAYGWHGHFFVPGSYIGESGFVTKDQIRELYTRGHIVGTHSWSHPERMSSLPWSRLVMEWDTGVKALSDVLGLRITAGSVPGGYYSRRVAEAAAEVGITALFTSEPATSCWRVNNCLVFGRFTVIRGMRPSISGDLARGLMGPRLRQAFAWNSKKAIKLLAGERFRIVSEYMLRYRNE